MSTSLSVVLIQSQNNKNTAIGTGFLIFQTNAHSYILTCAHVVRDVGGPTQVKAEGLPAEVVAIGEDHGLDLAVLRVAQIPDRPALTLRSGGNAEQAVKIEGCYKHESYLTQEPIEGKLLRLFGLSDLSRKHRVSGWYITINDQQKLQPGYSGSPVCIADGTVIGVMITSEGEQQGRAISIEALRYIWPEMPPDLLAAPSNPSDHGDMKKEEVPPAVLPPPQQATSSLINFGTGNTINSIQIGNVVGNDYFEVSSPPPPPPPTSISVYLAAHPKAPPPATHAEIIIDWRHYFAQGDPSPDVWATELLPKLEQHLHHLHQPKRQTLSISGLARNSVGIAMGFVFRDTANYHLVYIDRDQTEWRTDGTDGPVRWKRTDILGTAQSRDLLIEVGFTQPINRTIDSVNQWLNTSKLEFKKRIRLELPELQRFNPNEGIAMARRLRTIIAEERVSGGTTHILGSMSLGLSLLLGWNLNACGTIQCYELDLHEQYQPSCRLRS
ncbi:GUN4-like protein [Oscillochloris trichoides DG-6]|uniref:GUN4-like protein n=1 Tax=Oscillochloris trichoides DG-6 TaxID=765420 RepID=E1I9S4_9CHLR|nr:SAVED domain-containing protein [Oscillochloris trichoides]EFO82076.1 GUN4-like protein [Oscillochloris trichoides DG-6]